MTGLFQTILTMNLTEAIAWLKGMRSTCNIVPNEPIETFVVRTAQADAAMTEKAYWILKAEKEHLFDGD